MVNQDVSFVRQLSGTSSPLDTHPRSPEQATEGASSVRGDVHEGGVSGNVVLPKRPDHYTIGGVSAGSHSICGHLLNIAG